jgi:hypothetical protein
MVQIDEYSSQNEDADIGGIFCLDEYPYRE